MSILWRTSTCEFDPAFKMAETSHRREMSALKHIALVAHDSMKPDLLDWADYNRENLLKHDLIATGTTGRLLQDRLGHPVKRLQSGPLGGDQQLGSLISEGKIDALIFFWDPLQSMPHDPDVKALLRIAVVWNIPIACNRASADFLVSSPLMQSAYERRLPDHQQYLQREVGEIGGRRTR